jgi:hypothetical protein
MDVFALQIDAVARSQRHPLAAAAQVVDDVDGGGPIDVGRARAFPGAFVGRAHRENDDVELLECAAVFVCRSFRFGADARDRDDFLMGTLPGGGAGMARLDADGEREGEKEAREDDDSSHRRILHGRKRRAGTMRIPAREED